MRPQRTPAFGRTRLARRSAPWQLASRLAALLLLAAAPLLAAVPAAAQNADPPDTESVFPPPVHQTRIEAVYDADQRRIDGTMRLRWHNTASVPIEDLQFHLYLNAFSSNRSTFMRDSGGEMRGARHDGEHWGWIEVDSMRLPDGTDLEAGEELIAPDDGNPDDRTVARYPLPQPLLPGEWIVLEIDFTSQLPAPPFARTGTHPNGDYILAGQWYPKIAVFEDAGDRGRAEAGWNAHQFHPESEFYADFGDYDVTLDLPDRYRGKIGATGHRVEQSEADGRVRERYVQRGVHDFAWTADPNYVVLTDLFDPDKDVPALYRSRFAELLAVSEAEVTLTPVAIELFVQPSNRDQAQRYIGAAKAAIRGYGTRLGAYPWGTLTLVDPPIGAFGSGGMEYPTFITLGTHPALQYPPFDHVLAPEVVTVHEFGHQFFQGMIANNEFEEAWMDEGINTYYENEVMAEAYGPASFTILGLEMTHVDSLRSGGLDRGQFRDPLVMPAWRYISGGSYSLSSYPRTGLVLNHLQRLLGAQTFHRAMRAFFQQYRFTHPSTADFERTIQSETGQDLGWFFRQALHSTRNLDYEVRSLLSSEVKKPRGVFWRDGERVTLGSRKDKKAEADDEGADERAAEAADDVAGDDGAGDDGAGDDGAGDSMAEQMDSGDGDEEVADAGEDDDSGSGVWRSSAVVFRRGEFIHPVSVELIFADGTVVRRSWDGEHRWARWTFHGPSELISAEVDPDGIMVLDYNRLNNSRTTESDPAPALGYLTDILYWLQLLLAATGLLA